MLGRENRRHPEHRTTGYDHLEVIVDDASRYAVVVPVPNETAASAIAALEIAAAEFARLGVRIDRVLTDNGTQYKVQFDAAVARLGARHKRTRRYRPQTNGKAERFIQSALREWAYGIAYHHSSQRTAMLNRWMHHYNWHRPHHGIAGLAPVSRLARSRNNLLTLHT